jgi:hypothetical protein
MAMSTTAKLLTSVGLGVGAAIVTNGVIRQQAETQDATDATKPNFWFRYAPWISMAGPAAVGLLLWKVAGWGTDAAWIAALAGAGAAAAVPANDYVLTNLRKVPVTTIPMDVATEGLRGAAKVHQFAAAR